MNEGRPGGRSAAPVFAADPAMMTCKDMLALGVDGMLTGGVMMRNALQGDVKFTAMTDAELAAVAETACTAHPDNLVKDAMKAM